MSNIQKTGLPGALDFCPLISSFLLISPCAKKLILVKVLRKHPLKCMLVGGEWKSYGKGRIPFSRILPLLPLWNIDLIFWEEGQQTWSLSGTGENPLQGRGRNTEEAVKGHETQGQSDCVSLMYYLNIRNPSISSS